MDTPVPFAFEAVAEDVVLLRDQMVTMRDGVRLATDVYLPGRAGQPLPGPHPAVLERTPYGKALVSRSEIELGMARPMTRPEVAAHFARAGYAVVVQDCRGRHGSEGVFSKYVSEGEDGFDCAAWLVAQPWSDGRFATMGLSYAAHTQAALACLNPPGLTCMVMDSGGFASAYRCGIRQGGAFELKQATWAWNHAREAATGLALAALEAEDIRSWFGAMPWREGVSPLRAAPEYEAYLLQQWRAGVFDAGWKRVGLWLEGHYQTFPRVPVVLMSSWYDAYVSSTLDNYAGLTDPGRPLRLIMGPWLHGNRQSTFAGDVSFGPQAPLDGNVTDSWLGYRRAWFDRWMKPAAAGADEPPVRLFLMGGGSGRRDADGRLDHGGAWIAADSWPPPGARPLTLHLRADGSLTPAAPAAAEAPLSYDYDPRDPVPTIGGALTSGAPVFEGGGFDQREAPRFHGCRTPGLPLSARPDVLSFETAPLDQDLVVVGPIVADLFISSSAPDTDFTVKLIDLYPPSEDDPAGFALNLTDGILRCRYRNSWETPEPLRPGEVAQIRIEPFATANRFARGHRLRIDISSSNFPKYDVNPNTFAPEGRGRTTQIARNTVWCDSAHPSAIRLTVLP